MPLLSGVTVERVIASPPGPIFDLLADPRRHREIDGSGLLRDTFDGPDRLCLGARFGMGMKAGAPYRMINEVVEFETDRRIAWQPWPAAPLLGKVIGGRVFRYELEPVPGGTLVRETWDISKERVPLLIVGLRATTRSGFEKTLARIESIVTA
ncbi:MAG: dimethyladenosine transferase [Frankiales bacterium]|jgi:hypothetical protein|nr:dimethyladenosine transferase [Frankiales bacterium]